MTSSMTLCDSQGINRIHFQYADGFIPRVMPVCGEHQPNVISAIVPNNVHADFFMFVIVTVIVISKLLKCLSEARLREPAYS